MSGSQNVSGYSGSGSQLTVKDAVRTKITTEYYCQSPLGKMANWNGDAEGNLVCGGKVHYENSLGIAENAVCEGENGDVSHLYQRFGSDYLELCGEDKFTFKRDHMNAIRLCDRLNELDSVLFVDLQERMNQLTVPFALMKLIGSASAEGSGLGAIGVPVTGGVAGGLGDLNNPIKVDVSSSRAGGNQLQSGTIDMPTLINKLHLNMFAKGVTCPTNQLMVSGSGGLMSGFAVDKMCQDQCSLSQTGLQYNITQWMPSAINAAGQTVHYVVMHDPSEFWFKLYTLYMGWTSYTHHAELGGATLWGAKVHRPKAVSVAAVQFV
jgi:hypothetical protein